MILQGHFSQRNQKSIRIISEEIKTMKTKILPTIVLSLILFTACENDEPGKKDKISTSDLSFTNCNITLKSNDIGIPIVKLTGNTDGKLTVKMSNTECCCGTDSVSLDLATEFDEITVEIIDNGPFTWCYCPHELEFSLTSLSNKDYELTIIESEHAYVRDTFFIQFKFDEHLDTSITASSPVNLISNRPLDYVKTDLGGCNGDKSVPPDYEDETDTIIFYEQADSLRIFAGLNLTCCIEFGSESEITGDTLIMQINTLNDEYCNCICYYTFNYFFADYTGQGFYYQFYIDEYKRFEGKFNLP